MFNRPEPGYTPSLGELSRFSTANDYLESIRSTLYPDLLIINLNPLSRSCNATRLLGHFSDMQRLIFTVNEMNRRSSIHRPQDYTRRILRRTLPRLCQALLFIPTRLQGLSLTRVEEVRVKILAIRFLTSSIERAIKILANLFLTRSITATSRRQYESTRAHTGWPM